MQELARLGGGGAGEDVRMASDVLGGGVDRDVHARHLEAARLPEITRDYPRSPESGSRDRDVSTPGTSRQRWWKGVAKVESHITHGLACLDTS